MYSYTREMNSTGLKCALVFCDDIKIKSYPLKITPEDKLNIGFLTFKICYQAGGQSVKHYSTYLNKIT